jgi:hypothetical protein
MDLPAPRSALSQPQRARAVLRAGDRFVMEAEVQATPLGLLAIGGLVAAILLSVPPIVHAAGEARAKRRRGLDRPAP